MVHPTKAVLSRPSCVPSGSGPAMWALESSWTEPHVAPYMTNIQRVNVAQKKPRRRGSMELSELVLVLGGPTRVKNSPRDIYSPPPYDKATTHLWSC